MGGPLAGPEMQGQTIRQACKKNPTTVHLRSKCTKRHKCSKNCNHGINHTMVVFILQTQMMQSQLIEYMLPLTPRDPASAP